MDFARVINGEIVDGEPPFIFYPKDGGSPIDLRDRDLGTLASLNYYPVVKVPKPEDTVTTSYQLSHEVVNGKPTQKWVEHTLTAEELDDKALLTSLESRLTALEALVLTLVPKPSPESPDVKSWAAPTGAHDAVPPGDLRKFNDGSVRRNISGTWLVFDYIVYPRGWELVSGGTTTPPPDTTTPKAWEASTDYEVGDKVIYLTLTYECIQAHTSQVGWTPVVVPALWKRV